MTMRRIEAFTDSIGIEREGWIEHISDRGGSDISYRMRLADGSVKMVSGKLIQTMRFVRMEEITD